MADSISADIIQFPVTRRPTTPTGPDIPDVDVRLSTALNALSAALVEQQKAVERWRAALAELSASMRTVGSNPAGGAAR